MIRLSKHTQLDPDQIIVKAENFFGEKGEGLVAKESTPCCIMFVGSGGFVTVSVVDEQKTRTVDIETREFDYQVKEFLQSL
ncbi:MAG: hypothetical protein PVG35_07350 [Desulfobacterales bacterium]|jgi:hypothetical protein